MGRGQRYAGVRPASESTIEIDFRYRGVRCRERLTLEPSARNLSYAANLRGRVLDEIGRGTFDYAHHFPDSSRAALFAAPQQAVGEETTVETRLEAWYDAKALELEHSTLIDYRRIIDRIITPQLGTMALSAVGRQDVKDLIVSLGDVSAKRINNVLGPLRGMFAEALLDGAVDHDPCADLKIRRRRRARGGDDEFELDPIDPFTADEVAAIIAACADPQFRNFCQFNFATGLRVSEMMGLWWPRCDMVGGQVAVVQAYVRGAMKATKTSAGRRLVDLLPPALAALQAQRAYTQLVGTSVFCMPSTTTAWDTPNRIRDPYWTAALRRAGVRYRSPKQMRHTFASQALSAGENIMWVARQLGHKNWAVTAKFYARWIPSAAPDAGAKIAALWTGT